MSREAMKLALEALELEDMACRYEKEPTPEHIAKAITALREALAKPDFWEGYVPEPDKRQQALDKKAENARELGLDYEPAQQEPVVVFREIKVGEYVLRFWPSDNGWMCGITSEMMQALAEQPAQHPKTKQISECLAVLRPTVKGKFPHEQALEELVGYITAPQPAQQEYASFAEWAHDYVQDNLHKLKPAQRTWVGLTDEERKLVRNSVGYNQFVTAGEYAEHVQKATEFKLKEKNT
jgi:hypothetical protein